ncbi:MAG: MCE family protein [Gluconacetobacter diazotrophicus]|nr:MCE family protein [Gluconacetobacter diazotrophicus]
MAERSARGSGHNAAAKLAGVAVLAVAAAFAGYVFETSHRGGPTGYPLQASFSSANGLAAGADVMLGGVKVGEVTGIALDPRSMMATVRFTVQDDVSLPADSRLSIGSATLTAQNALMVEPGHATARLSPGATVSDTCDATSLEQQVSQYIFGGGGVPTGCGGGTGG